MSLFANIVIPVEMVKLYKYVLKSNLVNCSRKGSFQFFVSSDFQKMFSNETKFQIIQNHSIVDK